MFGKQSSTNKFVSAPQIDEEQQKKFEEIIELLVAAGYFRARISSLSPFDKVIGGMAWSITSSNADVDIDIFFKENAPIGQKIKLSEQILRALIRMKCPHVIQPNQIQGLDYIHIFPVIQWLVTKVIETREETGDLLRQFSMWQFNKHQKLPSDEEFEQRKPSAVAYVKELNDRYKPSRKFKNQNKDFSAREEEQVQQTLLEYGVRPVFVSLQQEGQKSKSQSAAAARLQKALSTQNVQGSKDDEEAKAAHESKVNEMMKNLDSVDTSGRLAGNVVGKVVGLESEEIRKLASEYDESRKGTGKDGDGAAGFGEETTKRQIENRKKQLTHAMDKINELKEEHDKLKEQLQQAEAIFQKKANLNARIVAEIDKMNAMETPENAKDLAMLKALVALNENLKNQEAQFRASCKRQLAELTQKTQKLKDAAPDEEVEERRRLIQETHAKDTEKLTRIRQLLAKKNRDIQLIERSIDEIPSRVELQQYQRMFVELYEQVHLKLIETRQYYISYNTLEDSRNYLSKEVSILKSIDDNYQVVMKNKANKDKFLESLQQILTSVTQNLEKVDQKLKDEKVKKDKLNEKYMFLIEKERGFYKSTKEFQEECNKNVLLSKKMEELGLTA
eukprot:TRINITY_DN3394_c0_g3_i1.p1 TRINITY_DN3394_c0_g3~~TRINITY_DN3394_c0_g3_i1.p1  ORF type:complete len:618 (-),score=210.90 TRINITY_DN3394_c0_g3_i1:96-1949(-)